MGDRREDAASAPGSMHVSCYVTAANRAAPVFELDPPRRAVRCVAKPVGAAPAPASATTTTSSSGSDPSGAVEWVFHTVFQPSSSSSSASSPTGRSAALASAFLREVSLPALRSACDGVDANVVAWGVHPTQKFRLLFGRSAGPPAAASPSEPMSERAAMEAHGQLGALLHAFFARGGGDSTDAWRLGMSSWLVVRNRVVDLLSPSPPSPPPPPPPPASNAHAPSSAGDAFVTLEAPSLRAACRILQTAKTSRIVAKQDAEHAHLFVRLTLARRGQASALHLVDLVDLREFEDAVAADEKREVLDLLHSLRQPPSPRAGGASASPPPSPTAERMPPVSATSKGYATALAGLMRPLLTPSARTFLYANVIDSRASLRESVALLNAVANLRGVSSARLHLQPPPADDDPGKAEAAQSAPSLQAQAQARAQAQAQAQARAQAAVAVGESLLSQLAAPPPSADASHKTDASEAMRWLDAFQQRKREILGARIDSTAPAADVLALASSRVEASHRYREAPSPTTSSVGDIYEQLRRSMLAADAAADSPAAWTADARAASDRRNGSPLHETRRVDLNALAAVSAARPPPRSSHDSSQQQEQSRRVAARASSSVQSACFSDEAEWDRIVSPSLPETDPPPTSPSSPRVETSQPTPVPYRASTAPRTPLSGLDFEAQCARVGVPSTPATAPDVDGLDPATADRVRAADAALLRRNYDALLTVVREQQRLREAAEARAVDAEHDREELRAALEVQIESLKLDKVALRRKVRLLEQRSGAQHALEQSDRDAQALQRQVQQLQERNVALELRLASTDGSARGSGVDLKKKYQQVVEEKLQLEQQLADLRRRERQMMVCSKLVGDSTRKVDQLSRDLSDKEQALAATRLGKLKLSAEMNHAVEKAELLHRENARLLVDKAATAEELVATKMYLASLEAEQKKAEVLDRFVQKHGYRMRELREQAAPGSGRYSSASGRRHPQPWRRDSEATACEERLLAAVKRSLPAAVPLVNKLRRRLELQELSLRELSEREVDLINMLVELVSDQPAESLKRMIEDEMLKLQLA